MIHRQPPKQIRHGSGCVATAILPTRTVGVRQRDLLRKRSHLFAANAKDTNLGHGIAVDLDGGATPRRMIDRQQKQKVRASVVIIVGALLAGAIPVSIFVLGDMLHFKPIAENPYIFLILTVGTIIFTLIMQFFRGKIEKIIERNLEKNRDRMLGGLRKKDNS